MSTTYTFMKGKVVVMNNGGGPEVFGKDAQVYKDARELAYKEISGTEDYIVRNYGRRSIQYAQMKANSR